MDFFVGMDIDVDIMTNLIEPLEHLMIYELPIQNEPIQNEPIQNEPIQNEPIQLEPVSLEPVPMEIDIYIPITAPLIRTMSSPF
jgi:hypothetical protein